MKMEIDPEIVYAALKSWQDDAVCSHYSPKDDDGAFQRLAEAAGVWERF